MLEMTGDRRPSATRPGFVRIHVTEHAMTRFITRYEAYYGVPLTPHQADKEFWDIISEAESEPLDGPYLEERRQAYPEAAEYYINFPWRFVFADNSLVTCEIIPSRSAEVVNPKIPFSRVRAEFVVEVEEDSQIGVTRLRRYFSQRNYVPSPVFDLILRGPVEINAIIKSLRAIGISIEYQRQSIGEQRRALLKIAVPQQVASYKIYQAGKRAIFLHTGLSDLFPRGKREILCYGITLETLQRVIDFVLDTSWHDVDWFLETLHSSTPDMSCLERLRDLQTMGYIAIKQWDIAPYHPEKNVWMAIAEIQSDGRLIRDSLTGAGRDKIERALYKRIVGRVIDMLLGVE